MTSVSSNSSMWQKAQPFVYGGSSGMFATCCIQPIDMVKVQIQLAGERPGATTNPFKITANLVRNDGFGSLYKGLSAGLLRQATYTTTRMGIFRLLSAELQERNNGVLDFKRRAAAGLAAGGIGAIIGNPCDLSLIRMQSDANLEASQRRNYKNVGDALTRIVKEEGVLALWKGSFPTVLRAMSLNVGMLATYDQAKVALTDKFGPGKVTTFASSAVAGFFASFLSLPFDFVKTRLQKQKAGPDGKFPYASSMDCVVKVAKNEGPFAFYRGFTTYYVRIAPHAMITLLALETLRHTFGDVAK